MTVKHSNQRVTYNETLSSPSNKQYAKQLLNTHIKLQGTQPNSRHQKVKDVQNVHDAQSAKLFGRMPKFNHQNDQDDDSQNVPC